MVEKKHQKQLTIIFFKYCYKNTVDIRIWERIKDAFVPISHGFSLKNYQIKYMSDIQELTERRLKEKSMLVQYINTAHSVWYQ